jgi:proteasome alpha subunit
MQMIPNEGKLGYDRAIVTFSPDGRLFQVEYAREAVKRGTSSVGVIFKDGVVLVAVRFSDELSIENTDNSKVHQIDEHIGAAFSGLLADSRVVINRARVRCQIYRVTYEEAMDTPSLVRYVADLKQMHTQYAGLRPLGVSFLFAGFDEKPSLFETDPGGAIFEWKAQAIGKNTEEVRKVLKDGWKKDMTKEAAIELALNAIKKSEKGISKNDVEIAVISKDGFKHLKGKERDEILKTYW